MTCPYLDYRQSDDKHEFDHDRPYCTVAETFVSPMKADICNDRHAFEHTSDCETYPGEEGSMLDKPLQAESSE